MADDNENGNENAEETAIEIDAAHRVYIVGRTQSGKTYLSRYLLRSPKRLVVCDPKRSPSIAKWRLDAWDRDTRRALLDGEDVRIRVVPEPGAKPEVFWESVLRTVFDAGGCTVYIDEVYLLSEGESSTGYPSALRDIWTAGAEGGIGAVAASQRPRFIPKYLISEAEHFFVFRLTLEADRRYVADFTHPRLEREIPRSHEHGFWYTSIFRFDPIYIAELQTGHGEGWGELMDLEPEEEQEQSAEEEEAEHV